MGSGSLNHMLQQMLDRWKLLAVSHHRIILHKKLLGSPMSWLAASCPELLLGASTVRSEGLVGATAGGGAACLAALGFLATPTRRLAACLHGQRLLGIGVEASASTVEVKVERGLPPASGPLPPLPSPQLPLHACLAPAG